jgi:hypothetical protein
MREWYQHKCAGKPSRKSTDRDEGQTEFVLVGFEIAFDVLFECFNHSKLQGDLWSDSEQVDEHAFVEGPGSLFGDGFGEGLEVAGVLLAFRDHFDFDVLEGHHGEHLADTRQPPAEDVLYDLCHQNYLLSVIFLLIYEMESRKEDEG